MTNLNIEILSPDDLARYVIPVTSCEVVLLEALKTTLKENEVLNEDWYEVTELLEQALKFVDICREQSGGDGDLTALNIRTFLEKLK